MENAEDAFELADSKNGTNRQDELDETSHAVMNHLVFQVRNPWKALASQPLHQNWGVMAWWEPVYKAKKTCFPCICMWLCELFYCPADATDRTLHLRLTSHFPLRALSHYMAAGDTTRGFADRSDYLQASFSPSHHLSGGCLS